MYCGNTYITVKDSYSCWMEVLLLSFEASLSLVVILAIEDYEYLSFIKFSVFDK